jgi:hypothetical protein
MAFDPDAYLSKTSGFDPDAYLASGAGGAAPAAPEEKEGLLRHAFNRVAPNFQENIYAAANMVRHPIDAAEAMGKVFGPASRRLSPIGTVQDIVRFARTGSPYTREEQAVGGQLAQAAQHPLETIAEHPVDTAMMLVPGLGEVATAFKLPRLATTVTRAGMLLDPVQLAGKGVLAGGKYVVAPTIDAAGRIISNFSAPSRTAGNALLEMVDNNPAAAINALGETRNMPVTPGYTPTLPERLYAGGVSNPTVATTANRLATVSPEMNRELTAATQRNVAALQEQLARVNERITQQANVLAPAAKADLEAVRGSLQASLDAETAKLGQAQQGITNQLSNATPQATGQVFAERGRELRKEYRETVKNPAYKKAYDLAGDAQIDVSPILTEVEQILDRPLTAFDPKTAPPVIRRLQALANRSKFARDPVTNVPTPPTASLQEVDAIRQAVNDAVKKAQRAPTGDAAQELGNLGKLHSSIDQATLKSTALSSEAKTAYLDALAKYRTEYAPRFKTGVAADLFSNTNKNQPRLLADDTVSKFLTNETSADQFVTTFRGDPAATAAMREGVERLYREKVTNPAQHEKFMQDYGDQLNKLDRAGLGLRDKMDSLGKEVVNLDAGRKALEARAKKLGVENMSQLVDKALASPSTLDEMLTAANGPARTALAQDLMQRATQNLDGATQYLTTNADAIKKVLRADNPSTANRLYNDAVDTAKWHDEFKNIDAPKATDVNVKVDAASMGKFTDAQLHDLTVVAQDIKRGKEVDALANRGQQAAAPNAGKLGTETGAGAIGETSIGSLNPKIIAARNAYKILAGNVNKKVAAELARVMYTNPDAAIAMLQDAAKRQKSKAARRDIYAKPIRGFNMLSKPNIAVNALAQPQPETQQ